MQETTILIDADGDFRMLYDDADIDIAKALGEFTIKRASHVEPTPDGEWIADMAPVGGPILGPHPTRTKALAAERLWLQEENLPQPM